MPPPFRLSNEHYTRIPLGSGDAAINIFTSAWPTLSLRPSVPSPRVDVLGPLLMLRDPWFAATLQPVFGVGDGIALGLEHTVTFNTHGRRVPLIPRVGAGVTLGRGAPSPWVSAGVEIPLVAGPDAALTLGIGYRHDEPTGHSGTLSFGVHFGDLFARQFRGGLFRP